MPGGYSPASNHFAAVPNRGSNDDDDDGEESMQSLSSTELLALSYNFGSAFPGGTTSPTTTTGNGFPSNGRGGYTSNHASDAAAHRLPAAPRGFMAVPSSTEHRTSGSGSRGVSAQSSRSHPLGDDGGGGSGDDGPHQYLNDSVASEPSAVTTVRAQKLKKNLYLWNIEAAEASGPTSLNKDIAAAAGETAPIAATTTAKSGRAGNDDGGVRDIGGEGGFALAVAFTFDDSAAVPRGAPSRPTIAPHHRHNCHRSRHLHGNVNTHQQRQRQPQLRRSKGVGVRASVAPPPPPAASEPSPSRPATNLTPTPPPTAQPASSTVLSNSGGGHPNSSSGGPHLVHLVPLPRNTTLHMASDGKYVRMDRIKHLHGGGGSDSMNNSSSNARSASNSPSPTPSRGGEESSRSSLAASVLLPRRVAPEGHPAALLPRVGLARGAARRGAAADNSSGNGITGSHGSGTAADAHPSPGPTVSSPVNLDAALAARRPVKNTA